MQRRVAALALAGLLIVVALAAPAGAAAAPGELVLHVRFEGNYSSDTVPFVRVRTSAGRTIAERRMDGSRATVSLRAGSYVVTSYWRPCDGPCTADDLPVDPCSRRFKIRTPRRGASETVTARALFRAGESCRMGIGSDYPPQPRVTRGGAEVLPARGGYCTTPGCTPEGPAPMKGPRLPVRAGDVVRVALGAPTSRLRIDGICGTGQLAPTRNGRLWTFRVPEATPPNIATCGRITLTVTYAGPGPLAGVRAVFGFRLRRAG